MKMRSGWRWVVGVAPIVAIAAGLLWNTTPARGQGNQQAQVAVSAGTSKGEWPTYGGNLASMRYSPLDQINASNFNKLEVAWRYKTDALGPRQEFNLQGTPLMVNGIMYATGGTRRAAVALDAATGEMLWMHSVNEGKRGESAPRQLSGRGLSYWSDGKGDDRVLYVTPGYQLVALDAKTGAVVTSFGNKGMIDLKQDDDQAMDPITGEVGLHATPLVVKDVIVVGAAHLAEGSPRSKTNQKGYIRGFDAKTGKRLWIFHTIPRPGEFGNETWEKDSWSYTGNTGVWAQMSADEELGLVYLPVELPTGDYYGGNRPGSGLFGESIVALDYKTGKRKWHYQLVHHGIWDMDIPCAPILTDITVDGRKIKAIAQPTKQSWLYVLDRTNGQPVWPIEERPVEQSTVPGEKTSPTQPFVTKPPAYDRQGVTIDDLIDFTPELRQQAIDAIKNYTIGPIFTPPVESKWPGPLATLILPSVTGGANWQGGSLDPDTNIFYIFTNTSPSPLGLLPADPARTDFGWTQGQARNPDAPAAAGRGGRGGAPAGADAGAAAGGARGGRGGAAADAGAAAGGGRGAGGGGRGGAGGGGAAAGAAAAGGGAGAQAGAAGRGAPGGGAPAGGGGGGEGGGPGLTVQGLPIIKPPYGRITALDLNQGTMVWQIAHGDTADNIKSNPALRGINLPRLGRQGRIGVLTTKSLVIAGEGGFVMEPNGQRGAMLRAYDKATGKDAGAVFIPAPQTGSPMTYMLNGRQYITVAISGNGYGAEYMTFRLPAGS
jgi:quinoprotein glucose dehydrogenase